MGQGGVACPKFTADRLPAHLEKEARAAERDATYKKNSAKVRKLDKHCRICGSMFNLETHHLVPRSLVGKKLRDRVENLLTLCGGPGSCHEQVTRHVIKLYPNDPAKGARGTLRVEKFDRDEGDYIVAMEAA